MGDLLGSFIVFSECSLRSS